MAEAVLSTSRTAGMIVMALAGGYLFGMLGNMVYPAGPGALFGALFGFLLGGLIGFCVTKKYKEYLEETYDKATLVPTFMQEGMYGHPTFTLYVTVEQLQDKGKDRSVVLDWWSNTDFYVRVKCGRNPVKATCVNHKGVFHETFKFLVEAQDKSITFELTDQDIFAHDLLGQVAVPIDEIYATLQHNGGKYTDNQLRLYSEKTRAGCLVVTFRCGSDTPNVGSTFGSTIRPATMQSSYGTLRYFDSNRSVSNDIHQSALVSQYPAPGYPQQGGVQYSPQSSAYQPMR